MNPDIVSFNEKQSSQEKAICDLLMNLINKYLPEAENKVWHAHPVWFLDDNPLVGYNKLKGCIRLMFWSGASFKEKDLIPGTGKFKDASIRYTNVMQINEKDLARWIAKSKKIQWDYKNIYKTKGKLNRLI